MTTPQDWRGCSFGQALAWGEARHGERVAVSHRDRQLSFSAFAAEVRAFARGLLALGVEPGERVALWMADNPQWLVARWAVPLIGAVLVPINTRLRDRDAAYILAQSRAATLVIQTQAPAGTDYLAILAQIAPDWAAQPNGNWSSLALPALRRVIGLDSGSRSTTAWHQALTLFDAVLELGRRQLDDGMLQQRMDAVSGNDVAQILYTSGTTARPKGAMVRHGALLQNNAFAATCLRLGPDDRYLSCTPLFTATSTFYTLALWLSGARTVVLDRYSPQAFCEAVQAHGITLSFFVDTIAQDLRHFAQRRDYDLSSLRTGTGAPLPPASFQWLAQELGISELTSSYGMSETSNAVTRCRWDDPLDKRIATNGRPVDGVEIRIADLDSGAPLPSGQVGEIRVRGYVVTPGYFELPEETRQAFDAEGWFRTGDLGECDADGYLIYRGRIKDMIKPSGFNVATQEIETFLKTIPGVREAAVVGVPDARMGEVAYAYVQADAGGTIDAAALIAHCHAHIASYKVPRFVEQISQWPRTGSDKIRKADLKERAMQRLHGSAAKVAAEAAGTGA